MDITLERQAIRDHKNRTEESLSLTAFVMACVRRAVDMNKYMHDY